MVQQNTVSRRAVAKGVAWSAPVIVASSAVPAYAASQCTYNSTTIGDGTVIFATPNGNISVPISGSLADGLTLNFAGATRGVAATPVAVSRAAVTVAGFHRKNQIHYSVLTSTPRVSSTSLPVGVTDSSAGSTTTLTAETGPDTAAAAVLHYNNPGAVKLTATKNSNQASLTISSISITVPCA